jgi:hypothetical protein
MTLYDLGEAPRKLPPVGAPGTTPEQQQLIDAQYSLYLAQRQRSGLGWLPGENHKLVAQANEDIGSAQSRVDHARQTLINLQPAPKDE